VRISVDYLYRDAGNNKRWGEALFENEKSISPQDVDREIRSALIDGEFFIAEAVGLAPLYFDAHDDDLDHGWHEYASSRESSEMCCGDVQGDISGFISALRLSKPD